jgi:putative membrane protein
MIVRPREHWVRMLFVWHGSVLKQILPQMAFMLLVNLVAWRTDGRIFGERVATSFTLLGVTLAVFLAFRNNVSYARYWEARQLWGELAIASRTLMSQVLCYLPEQRGAASRDAFLRHLIAFAYALNRQLRHGDNAQPLPGLTAEENAALRGKHFRPTAILNELRRTLEGLDAGSAPGAQRLWMLDRHLGQLSEVVGGCERIAATPFPYSYGVLLHRTVFVYCVLLPFGLADLLHMATPFVGVFVAYTLLALEEISYEIAEPFGTAPNDLALDAMCRNNERSLLELAGQPVLEPLTADRYHVLS